MMKVENTIKVKTEDIKCRNHSHISHTSKTEGTPYLKGLCTECKSWVYTDKKYCICCRRRVYHTVHHLRLKRIYNLAVKENVDNIKKFEKKDDAGYFIEVNFHGAYYHIPIEMVTRYANNDYTKDTLYQFQDAITKVRRPKTESISEVK